MSSLTVAPNSPRQTAASVNAPTVPTHIIPGDGHGDSKLKSPPPPPPPSQDSTTEQIIEKISNLQDLENQKYDDLNILLASNPTPDNIAQQKVLISDITQLTNIRAQLFNTLLIHAQNNVNMNDTMNANVQDKHTIVTLKENDLNARKTANAAISQDVENTKKMVDINVYYKKQYEARVTAIKGDPDMPLSQEEVAATFMRYAGPSVPAGKAYGFASALVSCEKNTPFRALWDLLF